MRKVLWSQDRPLYKIEKNNLKEKKNPNNGQTLSIKVTFALAPKNHSGTTWELETTVNSYAVSCEEDLIGRRSKTASKCLSIYVGNKPIKVTNIRTVSTIGSSGNHSTTLSTINNYPIRNISSGTFMTTVNIIKSMPSSFCQWPSSLIFQKAHFSKNKPSLCSFITKTIQSKLKLKSYISGGEEWTQIMSFPSPKKPEDTSASTKLSHHLWLKTHLIYGSSSLPFTIE